MDRNYMIACNASYENRAFYLAIFYQDPETGDVELVDDITEFKHKKLLNMSEEEFMTEFEVFKASQKQKQ